MRPALLPLILAALAQSGCGGTGGDFVDTELCMDVPDDATSCAPASEVDEADLFSESWCATEIKSVSGEGTLRDAAWAPEGDLVCCYAAVARDADPGCVIGRPYLEEGVPTVASVVATGGGVPGERWLAMARMEHASIAAFARLTLDLMALGAPLDLLAEVQRAAADEVVHARLCFELAACGGELAPGPMRFEQPIAPCADPIAVAVAAVREGCLGETLGAFLAAEEAERAEDERVAAVLRRIAADEARHAALSWRVVAWLTRQHADVREAVVLAFREPFPVHGEDPALVERARVEILEPAARALLAA